MEDPVYKSPDELEIDPDSKSIRRGAYLVVGCVAFAPWTSCLPYLAPIVGTIVLIAAIPRSGGDRFAAAQALVVSFGLVVGWMILQTVMAASGGQATLASYIAGAIGLVICLWGMVAGPGPKPFLLPIVGPLVFRFLFLNTPRQSGRPPTSGEPYS